LGSTYMNITPSSNKSKHKLFVVLAVLSGNALAVEPVSSLSELITGMQPGTWALANQNTFNSVWTPPQYQVPNLSGSGNISGIIRAWSGSAWDSNRGDMILYGGGHANYPGNDVYIWHSSNLQWERASLPTMLKSETIGSFTDLITVDNGATPTSAHTYDNNIFLPNLDRFLTFGGFSYGQGSSYLQVDTNGKFVNTGPYLFDPNLADGNKVGGETGSGVDPLTVGGNMWQNRNNFFPGGFGESIAIAAQENGKDVVYSIRQLNNPGDSLYKYMINDIKDPTKDTWTLVGTPAASTIRGQGAGALDTANNLIVRTGVSNVDLYGTPVSIDFFYWDLNQAGVSQEKSFNVTDNTGGSFPFAKISEMGLQYDPIGGRFLLWGDGNNVYSLTHLNGTDFSSGWTLALDNAPATNGPGGLLANDLPSVGGGVLGKWDFAPDYGVFVGLKDPINGSVWVYKPTNFNQAAVPLPAALWLFSFGLGLLSFNAFTGKRKNF
jgi:hypothetical protein